MGAKKGGGAEHVDDEGPLCPVCGAGLEWVDCDAGCEDGLVHGCGEDCCCCAVPEPDTPCSDCDGLGGWLECPNIPHPVGHAPSDVGGGALS